MITMTRDYVLQTLIEEHLWKVGESETFMFRLSQEWEFTSRGEEELYEPYKFSLYGVKIGTNETWSKRYKNMGNAFLHIVNHLNENENIQNKYKDINEWLLGKQKYPFE